MRALTLLVALLGCRDPKGSYPSGATGTDTGTPATDSSPTRTRPVTGETGTTPASLRIVFVSRRIPDQGSIYWDQANDLPGIGPHSRARPADPGRLVVLEEDGSISTLVDGSDPQPPYDLVDVNGPAVSWDGQTVVFAGLPAGSWDPDPARSVGGWRLFAIDADGQNLRQLTFSDPPLDLTQFGEAAAGLQGYDDLDPAFLPDGRIVFSSTRWPAYAQYSGVRATQLYVMDADGADLHRITAERNGADRPLVDPVTGRIVYSRWWRNHRYPVDDRATTVFANGVDASDGYVQHDGLTTDRDNPVGGPTMFRNAWQASSIAPDGNGLLMFTGRFRDEEANHTYGGAFAPDGTFYANYYPMYNMTEAGGFGGIRRYHQGSSAYEPVIGVTTLTLDYVSLDPVSYGVFQGPYATDPEVLPDGDLVISWAADHTQDYGLYRIAPDGSGLTLLYDEPGTSELRARVLGPRPVPPVVPDLWDGSSEPLPPDADGPYDVNGTFTFGALNIYFNAPVDEDIVSAPAVGSVKSIRFFIDHQRTSPGSFPELDWPIQIGEMEVDAQGVVTDGYAPALVPLFEQLRGWDDEVPLTGGPEPDGAAHVAGMNFGPPGGFVLCVGCHAGHSLIPVEFDHSKTRWSNLAPGASVTVSSSRDPAEDAALIDRKVQKGEIWRTWTSEPGRTVGEWARLDFRVPIAVQSVRLYDPRPDKVCTLHVGQATVELLDGDTVVATASSGPLSVKGTDVAFAEVVATGVRVTVDDVAGTFDGAEVAGLAEIEVIAQGASAP